MTLSGMIAHYQEQDVDFGRTIADFYVTLLAKQQSLGEEFEQILLDNLWDFYVRS